MYETTVTLQGNLGTEVTSRVAGDSLVASFRVACTPRRYQRKTESWGDGTTQWYSVTAWRGLAENCHRSLRRGDPVIVHGRLTVNTWVNRDGVEMSSLEVEATHVGHDLTRGTAVFTKTPKPATAPASPVVTAPEVEEPAA
jgi:single-strand DNA-binding protein